MIKTVAVALLKMLLSYLGSDLDREAWQQFEDIEKIIYENAFAHLPEGYAKVLYLHDAVGLEHREIASVLGVAEGTSKSQLFMARQKMRLMINRIQIAERQPVAEPAI